MADGSVRVHKKKVYISKLLNPRYIDVVKTYLSFRDAEIIFLDSHEGVTDLKTVDWDNSAAIVVQSPNYHGIIEDIELTKQKFNNKKTQLIVSGDPFSYGILRSPGECGADIYAGEGQVFGNYLSYGGPYLGLFAVKKHLMRKMPGRIIGKTEDIDGNEGYVLTLQTREQHIRRESATSNICTNQGLLALRATIYLSLIGKTGLKDIIKQCFDKAHYLAREIDKLDGYEVKTMKFVREFVVIVNNNAYDLVRRAYDSGFTLKALSNNMLLIAVTEKRTDVEIDNLIRFLKA